MLAGADCSSGSCVPGQHRDACAHGTHVASTVPGTSGGTTASAGADGTQLQAAAPAQPDDPGPSAALVAISALLVIGVGAAAGRELAR